MDYGFAHEGKVYTPNGSNVSLGEYEQRNAQIEADTLTLWGTQPDHMLAYFHFNEPAGGEYRRSFYLTCLSASVKTWLGARLGAITRAKVFTHNFGGRFVALTVRGTNGATYHGRASYDNGQCVYLHKAKR